MQTGDAASTRGKRTKEDERYGSVRTRGGLESGRKRRERRLVYHTVRHKSCSARSIRSSDIFVLVLELRWLEHTRNTHRGLALSLRLALRLGLLLFEEEVCVVPGELLELYEEVAQRQLEPVDIAVELAEADDERLDLGAERTIRTLLLDISCTTYFWTWGNADLSRFAVYSRKKTELLIVGSGTVAGSKSGTVIWFVSTSWNIRASSND